MFKNIKKQIKELAKNAVLVAESTLGTGEGKAKKQMAIDYIIRNLPFPEIYKRIISLFLSSFIDDVIELSVQYMKSMPKSEGE